MELKDRIKAARMHAGLNQASLAERVGITQTAISDLERGKSQSTSYIAQIARECRVSAIWLASGEGAMSQAYAESPNSARHGNVAETLQPYRAVKEYPLISWVAAGSWQEACDTFQPGTADEWLQSDANAGPHGYWLEVKGPSMQPPFTAGMRILVKPEGFDLISGKFYIAKLLDTGETTFKQYLRDGGQSYLQPLNTAFSVLPVTDNVAIIGQVIDAKLQTSFF